MKNLTQGKRALIYFIGLVAYIVLLSSIIPDDLLHYHGFWGFFVWFSFGVMYLHYAWPWVERGKK